MTTYFINCPTLDELKRQYKHLAQKHHPVVERNSARSIPAFGEASANASFLPPLPTGPAALGSGGGPKGGDTATMQAINAEYSARFEVLKHSQNAQAAEDATGRTRPTSENAGDFIAIVSPLLSLDGLEIELCGRWLWIGGETMRHKESLKAAGCRWSSSKRLWSWHYAEDGDRWHRGTKTMSQIRSKYGSTSFRRAGESDALPA